MDNLSNDDSVCWSGCTCCYREEYSSHDIKSVITGRILVKIHVLYFRPSWPSSPTRTTRTARTSLSAWSSRSFPRRCRAWRTSKRALRFELFMAFRHTASFVLMRLSAWWHNFLHLQVLCFCRIVHSWFNITEFDFLKLFACFLRFLLPSSRHEVSLSVRYSGLFLTTLFLLHLRRINNII